MSDPISILHVEVKDSVPELFQATVGCYVTHTLTAQISKKNCFCRIGYKGYSLKVSLQCWKENERMNEEGPFKAFLIDD